MPGVYTSSLRSVTHSTRVLERRQAVVVAPVLQVCSVYLLFWYRKVLAFLVNKCWRNTQRRRLCFRCSVYLLYWYKSTDTDS